MAPNLGEIHNPTNNPLRKAAIHFGAFLQLKGLLQEKDNVCGTIERVRLLDQFVNHYQPSYKSCLVLHELLATLRRYGVARQKKNRKNTPLSLVHIVKHPDPGSVPPPSFISRPCLYVDQNRVMRDRMVRSEVINDCHCRLCNKSFFSEKSKIEHVESDLHKFRLQYREKRSSFKDAVHGARIWVENEDSDSNEVALRVGQRRHVTVKVSLEAPYDITNAFEIITVNEVTASPLIFHNNVPIEVKVSAEFTEPGAYIYPLVVKVISSARICLMKELIFRVGSELMDQLAPVSSYIHQKNISIHEMEGSIVPGQPLIRNVSNLKMKIPLGIHTIPSVYNILLLHKLNEFDDMTEKEKKCLKTVLTLLCGPQTYQDALRHISRTKAPYTSPLNKINYTKRFHLLIDLEEMQEQRQIKNYDRKDERLELRNTTFFLEVPDLSEGRPSVNKGDSVHFKLKEGKNKNVIYEGIIHEIQEHGLLLGLNEKFLEEFKTLKDEGVDPKVDVRFKVNRFPKLYMHRALNLLETHGSLSIVFPEPRGTYFPPTSSPTLRPWINHEIAKNPEQQAAVRNIIGKTSNHAPYLIFGPPGTGKTVTLLETIGQVWYANQTQTCDAKQLVCAPSNEACNNIAKSLITTLPKAKVLRLFSLSSEVQNIPPSLLKHSNYDRETKGIIMPHMDHITDNHIIVVTIVSAGRLVTGGAAGSFRYVYIDESGQATEPEVLIAIAGILTTRNCPSTAQLILAGDPQQLGPILSSTLAKDFGLGVSLLERLMNDNALYKKNEDGSGYNPKYLTKLVQNYRSHETILRIPNKLFYDNELEPRGNVAIINKAIGWNELPNKKFPLIFHGVQGLDERESNSPSYFNRQEIDIVITYMKKLFDKGLPNNYRVKHEDIGVITPYRKQVRKFEKAFDILKWKITVGSVEKFQGSEKLIIFISTVRSNVALIDEDYRFKLGFLKNPKRFNVSITRAKALLVLVGNPKILRHDKQWYQLLKYCKDNGAYRGINFPEEDPPEHHQDHIAS